MRIRIYCLVFIVGLLSLAWKDKMSAGERDQLSTSDQLDPKSWGSDHVGKEFPDYVTGDECLFCHRDIGKFWSSNRHQLTVRRVSTDDIELLSLPKNETAEVIADDVMFAIGHKRALRFLRRSDHYGKLDLLLATNTPSASSPPKQQHKKNSNPSPEWDTTKFGDQCAGCHATAVDSNTQAFSALSIDCIACHGAVDLNHTTKSSPVIFSKSKRGGREVISICGQCHLRGGKSKSSKRPYPNTFVAGDNLFRDYDVDLSVAAINGLPPAERHIFENTRDVAVSGWLQTTCLTCHEVHGQSSEKHQSLSNSKRCQTCHVSDSDYTELRDSFVRSQGTSGHNSVCEY